MILRSPSRDSLRQFAVVGGVATIAGLLFGRLIAPFDLIVFIDAGRAVLHGSNPYVSVSSPEFRSGHAFVYPLFVAWVFAPLALLPLHIAERLFEVASIVAIAGGARLLGRRETLVPGLVIASATTIVGLQMGTINGLLVGGLGVSWHLRNRHPLLSGIFLGMIGSAKLFLLPLLAWPVLTRRKASTLSAVLTACATLGLSLAFSSLGPRSYLAMLSSLEHNETARSWSLASLMIGAGLDVSVATKVAPLLVGAGLLAIWRQRRTLTDRQMLGMLILASLLLSPILWSSYLVLAEATLLVVDAPELFVAFAGLVSWVLVTPDVASRERIAFGFVLSATLLVAAAVRSKRTKPPGWLRAIVPAADLRPVAALALCVAALAAAGYALLPSRLSSPLPTVAFITGVGLWTLRAPPGSGGRVAGHPA